MIIMRLMPNQNPTELLPQYIFEQAEHILDLLREVIAQQVSVHPQQAANQRVYLVSAKQRIAEAQEAIDAGRAPKEWVDELPCPVCDDTGWTETDSSHWGEHRSRRVSCECREGVQ